MNRGRFQTLRFQTLRFQTLLLIGVLVVASLATTQANAGWWHWRAYCGVPCYSYSYYGGWGCCPTYSPCYAGCGLLGRFSQRWWSHHYRYYWGCYTPVYSCCSVCGCYDCCCGGGTVIDYGTPSMEANPANPPTPAGDSSVLPEKQTSLTRDSAFLTVDVPEDAKIFVNGVATRSTGAMRRYVSRDLLPGFDYTYEVKAERMVDGQPVVQSKTVQLQAGDQAKLAFDWSTSSDELETALTLRVPEEARVYLAGNQTSGSGTVRTFRTTKLPKGQSWADYVVRVVVNDNGLVRSKQETITLRAGDNRELSFDFDVDKVAAAR